VSNQPLDAGENAAKVVTGIEKEGGKFICVGEKVFVLLRGMRTEISPGFGNHAYASLQIKHCDKGTAEYAGKVICQRVAVLAREKASGIRLAKFSALATDKSRLYIPLANGKLLQITPAEMTIVSNGENPDSFWVEHPKGEAFKFMSDCNVREALNRFEELCVNSQSCSLSNAWFVAITDCVLHAHRYTLQIFLSPPSEAIDCPYSFQ
jgi:hypothetical protein